MENLTEQALEATLSKRAGREIFVDVRFGEGPDGATAVRIGYPGEQCIAIASQNSTPFDVQLTPDQIENALTILAYKAERGGSMKD